LNIFASRDVTLTSKCREYTLACLIWCRQLLPCFEGELNLVCW